MKTVKLSELLAVSAWLSVFGESWLLLLRKIPTDAVAWGFLGLFLLIAVWASAVASPSKKAL